MNSRQFLLCLALLACSLRAASPGESASARRAFGGIQPRVSPDGQWIAVSYQGAVCKLPAEGGVLVRLTSGEGWDVEPAWSPDGQRLAFIAAPNFNTGLLRLINAGDGSPVKLPQQIRAAGQLWFHPDGQRLLGRFSASGNPARLAWCDLATGAVKPVEGIPDSYALRLRSVAALSPDGKWILFTEQRDREGEQGGNNGPQAKLWRIAADGGTPQEIAEWPARIYNLGCNARGGGVFIATDLGTAHNDVWHVPFANALRDARKLTSGIADEDWPSISADGARLVFTDNAEGATALVRLDPATGERRTLPVDRVDFRAPTATLKLKTVEKASGAPVVARVSLRQQNGKFSAPIGALYRINAGLGTFYLRGEETLTLPAGKYELLAFRGPEHRVARVEVELKQGEQRELTVALERWVDMAARGWFSGENHIHANYGYGAWYNSPRTILDQVEGEDLNVANMVVANSDGDAVFDREFFRGRADPLSTPRHVIWWNEEFRSTFWGHMTLFHLRQLVEPIFTGFKDTTNPWDVPTNGDIADRARRTGGAASYTHPTNNRDDPYDQPYAAKGLPVDVALGHIDTLDVMGVVYGNALDFWYRALNCGFVLPAAAGTDVFLNRIPSSPPGWGRVYVRLTNGLDYAGWVNGLKAGRSFVSNGPVLEFDVNGSSMGDVLHLDSPGKLRVKGRALSQHPLDKLELVQNGVVIATGTLSPDKLEATLSAEVRVERSSWLALRASGPAARWWIGGNWGIAAHSNPVWVHVKRTSMDARADAEFFLRWIDRLEADVKKRDRLPPGGAEHVEQHLKNARAIYQGIAKGRQSFATAKDASK